MSDLSNNGSGAATSAVDPTAPAKPKPARRTTAKTSTAEQNPMTDINQAPAESEDLSRIKAALQKIESRAEELRRWGRARQEMAREVVEERPLAVVGAAFGVGLLIGLISSRI
jgi:ElaB/YqjD/DUF883 family membrane-anchored ribosome-binding protein